MSSTDLGTCCTEASNNGWRYCESCGKDLKAGHRAPATVHGHALGSTAFLSAALVLSAVYSRPNLATNQSTEEPDADNNGIPDRIDAEIASLSEAERGVGQIDHAVPSSIPNRAIESGQSYPSPTTIPTPSCQIISPPSLIANAAKLGAGVVLRRLRDNIVASWVVPPRRAPGPDDISAAWLHQSAYRSEWIVQGSQSPQRDVGRPSLTVAQSVPLLSNEQVLLRTDRRRIDSEGREVVECGEFSNIVASPLQATPDLPAVMTTDWNAFFWCRSISSGEHDPFTIFARALTVDGQLTGETRLYATRSAPDQLPTSGWTLRFPPARVTSARSQTDRIRDVSAPFKLNVLYTPNGYAVTFLHQNRLHLGWLNADLAPLGDLGIVPTLGGTPGRVDMLWDGSVAIMVFADRAASNTPYQLRGARVPFGTSAADIQATTIDTTPDRSQNEIAPSMTTLSNGRLLVTWTHGPEHPSRSATQQILLRLYDTHFNPIGDALHSKLIGSDSEVVATHNQQAVMTALIGRGSVRRLFAAQVRCN